MITSVRPAAWAASAFCFSPPIGSTRPCNVTSPVMPTLGLTGRPVTNDASAVVIVMPAEGPSFGIAPDGTCRWNLRCSKAPGSTPSSFAFARTNDSAICAHSRLARPTVHQCVERGVGDVELVFTQSGLLALAREQVVLGDGDLLVLRVAVERDDLHTVEQRPGNGLEHVRRREEQHVRQVEVELEEVVAERV